MNIEATILEVSERGVRVRIGDGAPMWLPRSGPGIEWASVPEPGDVTSVRVPNWLAAKHRQLQELRYQRAFSLQAPLAGLNPHIANKEGSLLMAYDNNLTGVLFKNDKRENDRHPLYRGHCEIEGRKFWISAWLKTSERTGEKFMSLAFKPADDQRQQQPQERQQSNAYAGATGRDDRQQQRAADRQHADDEIPF